MALPISPQIVAKTRLTQTDAATPNASAGQAGTDAIRPTPASAGADGVELSQRASVNMGEHLAIEGPPFDLETVARIKEAIAEGRYPIDTRAISESLFAGYSDLLL